MATATAALQRVRSSSLIDAIGLLLLVRRRPLARGQVLRGPDQVPQCRASSAPTNGAIYGLVALGYTLVYGILQLINFAHGDVFALSGLVASTLILSVFEPRRRARACCSSSSGCSRRSRSRYRCSPSSTPRSSASPTSRYGTRRDSPRSSPPSACRSSSRTSRSRSTASTSSRSRTSSRGRRRSRSAASSIQWNKIAVFLIVIPVLLVLTWFVRSTRQGKAMRAVAQDTEASAMMGIDVNRTISVTFFLAGALAAVAGPRLPAPVQHPLRHGLRARADRVHRRGARWHRQPHGRRPRCARDRHASRPSTKDWTGLPEATGRVRSCSGS